MLPSFLLDKKKLQKDYGIVDWGFTTDPLAQSYDRYHSWVEKAHHSPLNYLSDHRKDLRKDVRLFFPEFKEALVFLFDYRQAKKFLLQKRPLLKLASYVLGFGGRDYHHELKDRLKKLGEKLRLHDPEIHFALSLDVHPVLERDLAYRAGLGWFGKNSMLISRQKGSFFLIGSLLLTKSVIGQELSPKPLSLDHCGTCQICVDSCPTQAIDPLTRTLVAQKCLSTFTIEIFKEVDPPEGFERNTGEVFGCDICQDVCPWNGKSLEQDLLSKEAFLENTKEFETYEEMILSRDVESSLELFEKLSHKEFRQKFSGTSFERSGKRGILKNLRALQKMTKLKR